MKKTILAMICVMFASTAFAQQSTVGAEEALKLEAGLAMAQLNELESQVKWAKVRGYSFLALAVTTGVSGYVSAKMAKFGFGMVEKIIPDSGDLIPGTMQAPWMVRIVVKTADRTAKTFKRVVPVLTAYPTLVATAGALIFTAIEVKNYMALEQALAEAKADYATAFGSIK